MKTQILAAIGETGLQPAAALNAALAANDRVKYFFSILQMASEHAAHPKRTISDLKGERLACGIDDASLDLTTNGSRLEGTACIVPGLAGILTHVRADMAIMAEPVLSIGANDVAARLKSLLSALPVIADDVIEPGVVPP